MKQQTAAFSVSLPGSAARRIALVPAWVWVTLLTAGAFALRYHHLGVESLWFDEADIVRRAQAPVPGILSSFAQAGENGPLYTLLLHFWIDIAGSGEMAVRALSLVFGVAGVPAIYYLGKLLLCRDLGLLAAVLLAVSPFHIWHSQDAKMYTLVVLMAILSSALYLLALEQDRPLWWALYVVATWVSLSTHMFSTLVFAAQLLVTPLIWSRWPALRAGELSRSYRLWHLLTALFVLLLPFLPIAIARVQAITFGTIVAGWYPVAGFADMLGATLVTLAVNRAPQPWELAGTLIVLALALTGAIPWAWRHWCLSVTTTSMAGPARERGGWLFLVLMFAIPLLVFALVTLRVPLFEPRYLIILLPFYLLLAAAGLLRLLRLSPLLGLLGLVAAILPMSAALAQVNYSPAAQKEEWREAMVYVRDHVRPRDVIIVHPGYLKTAVEHYYQNAGPAGVPMVPVVGVPDLQTENFGELELSTWLLDQITDHERAWLITSPPRTAKEDPADRVRWFFEGNRENWRMFDHPREYIGVIVYGYAFNGQPRSWFPQPTIPQQVRYEDNFTFRGYIYEIPRDDAVVQNASWLPLTLYWRFTAPPRPDQNYEMRLDLLDERGKEWAHWTAEPLSGYRRTSEFPVEIDIIDYRDVWIGGDIPPGRYQLALTVYPAGRPESPLRAVSGALPGATRVLLREPLTILQWQPAR